MGKIFYHLLPIFLGYVLDLIIGDPHSFPHPVRLIGNAIIKLEKLLRKLSSKNSSLFVCGVALWVVIVSLSFAIPWALIQLATLVHPYFAIALETIFCYQILATKALKVESMKVYNALVSKNMTLARHQLSMIVGRDTANLSEAEIAKAAVETVAENCADGVIAPMLFLFLGGAPIGFAYKAANTLDSMVGYKNEKYMYFGRFSAKLDDVLNFIPARLCAMFMLLASLFLKMDTANGFKIFKRDRRNHASPNSAQTESVCAGVLGVQLAGDAIYKGVIVKKPYIGDYTREICASDIMLANRLMILTSFIGLCLFAIATLGFDFGRWFATW